NPRSHQKDSGGNAHREVDERSVCHRCRSAREEHGPRRASWVATGEGACAAGRNPCTDPGCTEERLATECYGQGRQLHAGTMEQAHTIPRIPRAGVIQQPRGELDAPHRDWQKELDTHRQRPGRTESCGDLLGNRELPSHEDPGPRIPRRSAARSQQLFHPSRSRTHSQSLGRKTQSARLITPTHPPTVCLLSRLRSSSMRTSASPSPEVPPVTATLM